MIPGRLFRFLLVLQCPDSSLPGLQGQWTGSGGGLLPVGDEEAGRLSGQLFRRCEVGRLAGKIAHGEEGFAVQRAGIGKELRVIRQNQLIAAVNNKVAVRGGAAQGDKLLVVEWKTESARFSCSLALI